MRFSLATVTAFALAVSKVTDAAVVYVHETALKTETEDTVDYVVTVEGPAAVETVNEDTYETQIIYQAQTVNVTSQRTTVVTTVSTVESDKVSPANIKTDTTNSPITIESSSYSTPKAVYPVVVSSASTSSFVAALTTTDLFSSATVPSTFAYSTSLASSTSQYIPSSSLASVSSAPEPTSSSSSSSQEFIPTTSPATSSWVETSSETFSQSTFSEPSSVAPSSTESPSATSSSTALSTTESPSSTENPSTTSSSTSQVSQTSAALQTTIPGGYNANQDIFQPIATVAPPPAFSSAPLDTIHLPSGVDSSGTIQTNKFFSNMIIDDQTQPVYCLPYKLTYTKNSAFQGISVSYTDASERVFGPADPYTNAAEYFVSPVGLNSFVIGARELNEGNIGLQVSKMDTLSADATLTSGSGSINFPMLQGMGFVTAEYDGTLTPFITTPLGLQTLSKRRDPVSETVREYQVTLGNGASWLVYVTLPSASSTFELSVEGTSNNIIGSNNDAVVIQLAYLPPAGDAAGIYRQAAGTYPVSASLYGSVSGDNTANHGINYQTKGSSNCGSQLIFALPHHVTGFVGSMAGRKVDLSLDSPAKGAMSAYLTNSFDFCDTLPTDILFMPWSSASAFGDGLSYSAEALQAIAASANKELQEDMEAQVMGDSTYFSGKALDKFAYILLVVYEILQDKEAAAKALARLQDLFAKFVDNQQTYPLIYDTVYKGITSCASLRTGDVSADFGSPAYSDHHFHYGYFVHAAAVIGHVDKALGGDWAQQNADWVNSLVRDVANPSGADPYFPVSRYFDWYSGHSWAKGLFASADGKDEESTSEDYNFAYGMKLWGRVIGDQSMESRGDLMLAVTKRSMAAYFYMAADNAVQPDRFIGNRVPGITFENKLHHTTYFGGNIEYIQGIHMIPVTPVSSYFRGAQFVQQEWDQVLASVVPSLDSGWLGILRSNQALFDPKTAYNFFSSPSFQPEYLDGGASLTWYLAFSAGVGGSQA